MSFKRKAKRIPAERRTATETELVRQNGFGTEMPPQKKLVEIYFDQKGFPGQAEPFYHFFEEVLWSSPKGTPYRNWKLLATDWIFDYQQSLKLRERQWQNAAL
jgi:hypothetical protein